MPETQALLKLLMQALMTSTARESHRWAQHYGSVKGHLLCAGTVTQPQAVLYYTQRTSQGGLLITEATCIQVVSARALLGSLHSV